MINALLGLLLIVATTVQAALPDPQPSLAQPLQPSAQQAQTAFLATMLLSRLHYKAPPLDHALSKRIFDHYLKALDADKLYFTKADLERMAGLSTRLDDAIIEGDLSIPFDIFNLYAQRKSERFAYARSLLRGGFDFAQKESLQHERRKQAWPDSHREMEDLWRKWVKNDWLQLKLSGKDDESIVRTLDRRYESLQQRIGRTTGEDVFQAFMNAYTTALDPHSNYLGVQAAEDFGISMRLSLYGIGVTLAEKDEYTTVEELTPGGPASLSGQLTVGDRIVGVAEGEDAAMIDIKGWPLADALALIHGGADSLVRLEVLPAEAGAEDEPKLVTLMRKKIVLDDQSAKKSMATVVDGATVRRIGVITLPSFYRDFEARQQGDPDYKSATRDVARALAELKQENIDGVLLDLRNNGGGSLSEAVDLAGLFVGAGPIVQQRDALGEISITRASGTNGELAWDGPLAVLINRGSASAAEIFAAAVQDYRRGLVIGELSFGKGTVQVLIDLDELTNNDKHQFGELKITTAQFFRINGGSTQLRGVKPDIALPMLPGPDENGEAGLDNALPWVKIKRAPYVPAGDLKGLVHPLAVRHQLREKQNKDLQDLEVTIAELKRLLERRAISLNESERRHEREALAARLKLRTAHGDKGSEVAAADGDQPVLDANASGQGDAARKNARGLVSAATAAKATEGRKDLLLIEAAHILSDEVGMLAPKLAAKRSRSKVPGYAQIAGSDGS